MTHNLKEIININNFPKISFITAICQNIGHGNCLIIYDNICKKCSNFVCSHCTSKNNEMCVICLTKNKPIVCQHHWIMNTKICYECKKLIKRCKGRNNCYMQNKCVYEFGKTYCVNCYKKTQYYRDLFF